MQGLGLRAGDSRFRLEGLGCGALLMSKGMQKRLPSSRQIHIMNLPTRTFLVPLIGDIWSLIVGT